MFSYLDIAKNCLERPQCCERPPVLIGQRVYYFWKVKLFFGRSCQDVFKISLAGRNGRLAIHKHIHVAT